VTDDIFTDDEVLSQGFVTEYSRLTVCRQGLTDTSAHTLSRTRRSRVRKDTCAVCATLVERSSVNRALRPRSPSARHFSSRPAQIQPGKGARPTASRKTFSASMARPPTRPRKSAAGCFLSWITSVSTTSFVSPAVPLRAQQKHPCGVVALAARRRPPQIAFATSCQGIGRRRRRRCTSHG